jgi:hypothetical protein
MAKQPTLKERNRILGMILHAIIDALLDEGIELAIDGDIIKKRCKK